MPSFNLVIEKWIPFIWQDNTTAELGLQEVLVQAHRIKEIFDPSPLVTVSLHRLLLAILHRNFGPANEKEWAELWQNGKGKWDEDKLAKYFHEWQNVKHRFDLFDEKYPFYQCASLPFSQVDSKGKLKSYEKPVSNLFHELARDNNATLFDHTVKVNPKAVSPAESARVLVAFQPFSVGGRITTKEGQGSSDDAPLAKGAVAFIQGANLFQTLMLNFHKYNTEEPFKMDADDVPAWERDKETIAEDRRPRGYLDLLTWQSRCIRLRPELNEHCQTVVKQVVIMRGNEFPDKSKLHTYETMVAFTIRKKAKPNEDPWPAVALQEERALWRDSLALFQSISGKRERPKTFTWLYDLIYNRVIPKSSIYNLSIMGLVKNRAKVTLWRHERLPLPLKYLEDEDLIGALSDSLKFAEKVGTLFLSPTKVDQVDYYPFGILSKSLLPLVNGKTDINEIKEIVKHLAPARPYWASLGISFNDLLKNLAEDRTEESSEVEYGKNTRPWWAEKVAIAARDAFEETTRSLDRSARVLKAVTQAESLFNIRLGEVVESYKKQK